METIKMKIPDNNTQKLIKWQKMASTIKVFLTIVTNFAMPMVLLMYSMGKVKYDCTDSSSSTYPYSISPTCDTNTGSLVAYFNLIGAYHANTSSSYHRENLDWLLAANLSNANKDTRGDMTEWMNLIDYPSNNFIKMQVAIAVFAAIMWGIGIETRCSKKEIRIRLEKYKEEQRRKIESREKRKRENGGEAQETSNNQAQEEPFIARNKEFLTSIWRSELVDLLCRCICVYLLFTIYTFIFSIPEEEFFWIYKDTIEWTSKPYQNINGSFTSFTTSLSPSWTYMFDICNQPNYYGITCQLISWNYIYKIEFVLLFVTISFAILNLVLLEIEKNYGVYVETVDLEGEDESYDFRGSSTRVHPFNPEIQTELKTFSLPSSNLKPLYNNQSNLSITTNDDCSNPSSLPSLDPQANPLYNANKCTSSPYGNVSSYNYDSNNNSTSTYDYNGFK